MTVKFRTGTGSALLSLLFFAGCSTHSGIGGTVPSATSPSLLGGTTQSVAIAIPSGGDLVKRSTFRDQNSLPWMPLFLEPARGEAGPKDGAYCLRIDHHGKNLWDVQLRHREMTLRKNHTYYVRYSVWSDIPAKVRAKIGQSGAPFTEYWAQASDVSPRHTEVTSKFQVWSADDPTVEFAFHLSDESGQAPVNICFDDLHLIDPEYTPPPESTAAELPGIRGNQIGYFRKGPKRATWVITGKDAIARAEQSVPFELVNRAGIVVYRGVTEKFGRDPSSGVPVERLDFSKFTGEGDGFRLRIAESGSGGATSDEFAIRSDLLRPLSRDALRYFYFTRSGIALKQPFVEKDIWQREVGHPTDTQVPCAPDAGCSYSLDVSGGWYDAGDYGKYVVNGGLSVWLLLNLWETAQELHLPVVGKKDGDLHLPESGNGAPDLLDEARWELEWMMKMQVPEGDPRAGLVHHKMHDIDWTALGTPPVLDPKVPRQLRPVSTAATLNLAATAAQAARVYAKIDPAFAKRCLLAAQRAWKAAEAHPNLLITGADHQGGGAYEDDSVSDERFWAAAELYVTTGEPAFLAIVHQSPHYLKPRVRANDQEPPQSIDWRATEGLGMLSLALDRTHVSAGDRAESRKAMAKAAEFFVGLSKAHGFGQPYSGTHYPWGSNSFLLSNGVLMAEAHAFTKDPRFLEGALAALDTVLGRNALAKSYISGYGSRPLVNPHHRLWAPSVDPRLPPPPPGVISGGPNSDLQDPYSKAGNTGCIGQMCYFDHVDAYSANEVAINWNAELSWLVAYLNAVL